MGRLWFGLCFEALCGAGVASLVVVNESNRACSMMFCRIFSALGSAGSQYCSRFVELQKALQSWKWECAYMGLDNHSSLHIYRLIVAETKIFLKE